METLNVKEFQVCIFCCCLPVERCLLHCSGATGEYWICQLDCLQWTSLPDMCQFTIKSTFTFTWVTWIVFSLKRAALPRWRMMMTCWMTSSLQKQISRYPKTYFHLLGSFNWIQMMLQVSDAMARKMSQSIENQKGRKNKAFAAIKTDLEEKERQKKRTRSNKVIHAADADKAKTIFLYYYKG